MLTVLSPCGRRRAVVAVSGDRIEIEIRYYRQVLDDSRGYMPGTRPLKRWRFVRAVRMCCPLHVALDHAQKVVNEEAKEWSLK